MWSVDCQVVIPAPPPQISVASVQRRTVRTLVTAQIASGLGISTAIAVGALLVSQVFEREELAGLVLSFMVLGSAIMAVPSATLSAKQGRRAGLGAALMVAAVGGLVVVVAAQTITLPLLLVGMILFGGGSAAGLQARFAAVDLADPERRARTLSVVVWATTVGAVLGPNLAEPAGRVGESVGVYALAGPFLLGAVALAGAATLVWLGLRPDPLLLARSLAEQEPATPTRPGRKRGTLRTGLSATARSPHAMVGLTAIVVAHTVMVSVMVMTPIHMDHGHASLQIIGLVISIHIAGMYAFSPVMGWLADRFGRMAVILAGAVVLGASVVFAGLSPVGHSAGLTLGLFLLGLGWSACLVAGSTLLTDSVTVEERPAAQGTSDLLMNLAAAGGGGLSGVVVAALGYAALNVAAGILLALIGLAALRTRFARA